MGKFDLNKALNAARLYTKIDYGNLNVPNITGYVQEPKQDVQKEEKKKNFGWSMISTPSFPGDVAGTSAVASEYYKDGNIDQAKEIQKRQDAAGVGATTTALSLPYSLSTIGIVPTVFSTATGYGGAYAGQKAGEWIDNRYGTNIAPWLTFGGGMLGGITGYKGLVRAGSNGLLKGKGNLYGKSFMGDVMADIANSTKIATPSYGKVKWYGPTMGKTTAAQTNTNLVDFDDYIRPGLEDLATEMGMTRQQLMMSENPTVRERARQLMLQSIDDWRHKPQNDGKTLVISKSDVLQDPIFDNQPLVLKKNTFLQRNYARGETDVNNSIDWYNSTRRKGGSKLMEWPDETGVYISELEPFTPDPHKITFTPTQPVQGNASYNFERSTKPIISEKNKFYYFIK